MHTCIRMNMYIVYAVLRVICCSFGEVFTLNDWHNIAQWVLLLTHRNLNVPNLKKLSTTSMNSSEGEHAGGRTARVSSISSVSGVCVCQSAVFHVCSCLRMLFEEGVFIF